MPAHAVCRDLPFTREQLFDLVADVERYPEFVPHWVAARVRRVTDQLYYTDQVVELKLLHLQFRSKTMLVRPERIEVTSSEKPFRFMRIGWEFASLADGTCRVGLKVEFDVSSGAVRKVIEFLSGDMARRLVDAFETRAREVYGRSRVAAARAGVGPFVIPDLRPARLVLAENAVAE